MWGREVDGKVLTFHLAGINNQNFLMRDEETGSYWQQITGQAVSGPMRGRTLPFVHSDELSFRLWRGEQPRGRVLAPVAKYAGEYEEKDWDVKMDKARSILQFPNSGLPMREQVFGIFNQSASRAFPVKRVLADRLVLDHVGERVGVMLPAEGDAPAGVAVVAAWGRWSAPKEMARGLYGGLRALDGEGCTVILCPLPPAEGIGAAIRDRLLKAGTRD